MTVYGYARVSTENQSESGLSLEEQQRQIRAYSEAHRLGEVERIFIERAVSGSVELGKRAAGAEMTRAVAAGDIVICSKLDRMFRSARDALNSVREFETRRVAVHFLDLGGDVSTNGVAKLFFTIMSSVAEFERNRISERQREAKHQAIAEGRYIGGRRRFGFDIVVSNGRKILVPNEQEQRVLQFALDNHPMKLKDLQLAIRQKFEVRVSLATLSRHLAS